MLTYNGIRGHKCACSGRKSNITLTTADGYEGLQQWIYGIPVVYTNTNDSGKWNSNSTSGGDFICIGSGNSDPIRNSYKLDNMFISEVKRTAAGVSSDWSNWNNPDINTPYYILSNTFMNVSNSSIIIKEIGLFRTYSYGENDSAFMLDRKVLETPVTLEPNDTVTFTYTLSL